MTKKFAIAREKHRDVGDITLHDIGDNTIERLEYEKLIGRKVGLVAELQSVVSQLGRLQINDIAILTRKEKKTGKF